MRPVFHHFPIYTRNVKIHRPIYLGSFVYLCPYGCEVTAVPRIREKLKSKLFFAIGSSEFSCRMFLEVNAEDDLQECQVKFEIFKEYILGSG